ncbi:urease accessory UreF family protein [Bradyrhizobium sp. BRP56]|uniref:urease accessory protein UreF n=1 Tax=Bradyrhizobium sp. BRP56 TaxID=2793819 RepID=UPI001CD1E7D5|nr:urease accessory UreF family protein [Bradyrhizobium sp. BRP56]MCA1394959.1 urease accessory protein UreF [Bradyrhizobium sp. BRP56]
MLSTLRALWQADGTFPSGSFAFSYGLEGAIALRQGMQPAEFAQLVDAIIRHRWATFDRIALLRSFRAGPDLTAIAAIDREVEASTLFGALRRGSRRNGVSFLAAHARLGNELAASLRDAVRRGECLGHIAVMQGGVWSAVGLDEQLAQLTSGYAAASGLITAAIRLGAIGVLQGQVILRDCLPLIERFVAEPVAADAALESFLPFLDVASARHEQADLRLFAN